MSDLIVPCSRIAKHSLLGEQRVTGCYHGHCLYYLCFFVLKKISQWAGVVKGGISFHFNNNRLQWYVWELHGQKFDGIFPAINNIHFVSYLIPVCQELILLKWASFSIYYIVIYFHIAIKLLQNLLLYYWLVTKTGLARKWCPFSGVNGVSGLTKPDSTEFVIVSLIKISISYLVLSLLVLCMWHLDNLSLETENITCFSSLLFRNILKKQQPRFI